jgi:2-oxo-3-hexenedioate decarboxylase
MDLKSIAKKLDKAALEFQPINQVSIEQKLNLEEAYKIQNYLIEERLERGELITGYKLGFTSKAKMKQMNVDDLIWGVLTNEMEIKSKDKIDLKKYIHPRAEPEIAFRVSKNINRQIEVSEIVDYVDKMAVAIEVIDSRYRNFKFSLEDVVADNCSSIGYCIGEWQDLKENISNLDIQLKFNSVVVQKGKSKAILDNPYQSIIELTRLASASGLTLKKGQIILAGAATAAEWITPKTKISAEIEGIGGVSFDVG